MTERKMAAVGHSVPVGAASADDGQAGSFPLLQAFVAGGTVGCPRCGYNLRQISTNRCPECGQTLRLVVAREEQPLGAWLVLLVMLSLAAGPGLFMVAGTLSRGRWLVTGEPWLLTFSYGYVMASIPLMILVAATGRWFCRWPRLLQWGVALLAAGLNVMAAHILIQQLTR